MILALLVLRPVIADSLQTIERSPVAIHDACNVSLRLEGCHVRQALLHNKKLYFLIKGSQQGQPFSALTVTSEDGENPSLIPFGALEVTSFALDSRDRLAYLVKLSPGPFSDFAVRLRDESGVEGKSHKPPNLGGETMRLAANGLGIVLFGMGYMVPILYDGAFLESQTTSFPTELGRFSFATPFGREQFAFISQITGAIQIYSGNAFSGTASKVDFQQIPFPDIQKNLPSMGQPNGKRAILVDASSNADGSLFLKLSGYQLSIGAVVVETLPLDPKNIARVYRLQLGTSDRLKNSENPTGQMFPISLVATSKTLVLAEGASGTFAVYRR